MELCSIVMQIPDTYKVKLKVVLAGKCVDSTQHLRKYILDFIPDLNLMVHVCIHHLNLADTTKSRYGRPSTWTWNFGDETTEADTSHSASPTWKYNTLGLKTVQLIVGFNERMYRYGASDC